MNDKFTNMNPEDANFANKLNSLSEQTDLDPRFANELERKLKATHKPKTVWLKSPTSSILPSLGWVALAVAAGLVLIWSIQNLIPAPQPGTNSTPSTQDIGETSTPLPDAIIENATPAPNSQDYDWRSTKLFLSVLLPQPDGADSISKLYTVKEEQPPSMETVTALAAQFGLQGDVYKTPSTLPGNLGYLVTDGKQRLYVQSDINFSYYTDYPAYSYMSGGRNITDEQATAAIDAFIQAHGLTFTYRIENPHMNPGMYYILPLLEDNSYIQFNYNMPSRIEATLDETGQVILFASYRTAYNTLDGEYGIISAEEAFQQVLNSSDMIQNGVLESMRSGSGTTDSGLWSRTYPDNETITIYGQPLSYPANTAGGLPFITIGQFTATGNVAGLENVDSSTYIEATGQFVNENGIRRFVVDSWKAASTPETYLSGSLRREGDQTILTADDGSGDFIIEDAPEDVPLNTTSGEDYLVVHGFMANGKIAWDNIQYYPSGMGGGGGGGGGLGFYQLNLSGTPVPFPTAGATPQSTGSQEGSLYTVAAGDSCLSIANTFNIAVQELITANNLPSDCPLAVDATILIPYTEAMPLERWEGQRGILNITIYEKTDGSRRVQYGFITDNPDFPYLLLEGGNLDALQKYNGHPVDIWGTVGNLSEDGMALLNVERFEIPFPDLQYQIIKGTQKSVEAGGQSVLLFTDENGNNYVELGPGCNYPFGPDAIVGQPGDPVLVEVLPIPGLTFGEHPAVCVYSSVMAINPKTNQPVELTITADQPSILPEPPSAEAGNLPTVTIETVELIYYVPNPAYGNPDPNGGVQYIQPVWRFYGHYSNGDEFEFLVQALKQEFLLPDIEPSQPPG